MEGETLFVFFTTTMLAVRGISVVTNSTTADAADALVAFVGTSRLRAF